MARSLVDEVGKAPGCQRDGGAACCGTGRWSEWDVRTQAKDPGREESLWQGMCEQVVGSYAAMPQPGAEGNTQEEEESGTECEVRSYVPGAEERTEGEKESGTEIEVRSYAYVPGAEEATH